MPRSNGFAATARAGISPVTLALLVGTLAGAQTQQPVFRSGVDVVLVDVHVVDGRGRPITDLRLADFEVAIDRQRRRVVSADLLRVGEAGPIPVVGSATIVDATGRPTPSHRYRPSIGRNVMLAVDLRSLHPRHLNGFRQSLVRFVLRMAPDDRVGLYLSPPGEVLVEPTTDHDPILRRLDRMEGQYAEPPTVHYINISEVVDIMAGDGEVLRKVIDRECHDTRDALCRRMIPQEAFVKGTEYEKMATAMITDLRALFEIRSEPADPLTIVLVSGGIMTTDRIGGRPDVNLLISDLAARAARVNATLYTVHLDTSVLDSLAPTERLTSSSMRDGRIRGLGLDRVNGLAGGELVAVEAGDGRPAFDRILGETAASYLLAVAPEDRDRDGESHVISVKVRRRGAQVRSRAMVTIPPVVR